MEPAYPSAWGRRLEVFICTDAIIPDKVNTHGS
jgi:hypothetical protein